MRKIIDWIEDHGGITIKRAFILSLLIHFIGIVVYRKIEPKKLVNNRIEVRLGGGVGDKLGEGKDANGNSDNGNGGDDLDIVPISDYSDDNKPCDNWFGGIGVSYDPVTYKIIEVPEGYPAYRNGILKNDYLINEGEIRGEPKTDVVVKIRRGAAILTFPMKRAKICLKGK
jgi:hypothetical protein